MKVKKSGLMFAFFFVVSMLLISMTAAAAEKKGWTDENGYTYYYNADGKKYVGFHTIDGKEYYFRKNGRLCRDLAIKTSRGVLYFTHNGTQYKGSPKFIGYNYQAWFCGEDHVCRPVKGWKILDGWKYYISQRGKMYKGKHQIGKNYYFFDGSGKMVRGKVADAGDGSYYFQDNGIMFSKGPCFVKINERYWACDENNRVSLKKGWIDLGVNRYFMFGDARSYAKGGWIEIENKYYYFDDKGRLARNTVIDGYQLDANGKILFKVGDSADDLEEKNEILNELKDKADSLKPLSDKDEGSFNDKKDIVEALQGILDAETEAVDDMEQNEHIHECRITISSVDDHADAVTLAKGESFLAFIDPVWDCGSPEAVIDVTLCGSDGEGTEILSRNKTTGEYQFVPQNVGTYTLEINVSVKNAVINNEDGSKDVFLSGSRTLVIYVTESEKEIMDNTDELLSDGGIPADM